MTEQYYWPPAETGTTPPRMPGTPNPRGHHGGSSASGSRQGVPIPGTPQMPSQGQGVPMPGTPQQMPFAPNQRAGQMPTGTPSPMTPQMAGYVIQCDCSMNAIKYQCRQGEPANVGRYFVRCPHPPGSQCKFFMWLEAENPQCNHQSISRTGSNAHVTLLKCQHCGKLLHRARRQPGTPVVGEPVM
jgi:hypothetical protein